jgi:hypothetical protein
MTYTVHVRYSTAGSWREVIALSDKLAAEQTASRLRRANQRNGQFLARVEPSA